jgi:hypothetical protein
LLLHKLIFYYCELIILVTRFSIEIFVCNVVQALKDILYSPSTVRYKHTAKRTVKIPCVAVEICTFTCLLGRDHCARCGVVLGLTTPHGLMCLLQLSSTVEYLYRYLQVLQYQYRAQKFRNREKTAQSHSCSKTHILLLISDNNIINDVDNQISTMECPFSTLQSSKYISFQRRHRSHRLFSESSRLNGSADRPNIIRSDYMMIGPLMMILKTIIVQLLDQY